MRVSSHGRLMRPVYESTSSAEPTFTTMRRACCRGEELAGTWALMVRKLYAIDARAARGRELGYAN